MNARQERFATYHDRKVLDQKFDVGDKVYVLDCKNKDLKLHLKWLGPFSIRTANHPIYEVQRGSSRKWYARHQLKPAPNTALVLSETEPSPTPPEAKPDELEQGQSSSSEEEDVEQRENLYIRADRGVLRRNPAPPPRYGDVVTHAMSFLRTIFY